MKRPVVLVVTRRTSRKHKFIDYVGEFHLQLLIRVRTLPVMVPVVEGTEACLPQYMEDMRGLLLVEGEDIEPQRYDHDECNLRYLEKTHPLKDEIEVRLARHALRNDLPILGICRGSQLLNVIYGGSLYGDVQKEKQSELKHINYGEHYDEYRHLVRIVPGTPLKEWYRRPTLKVNSYHHQGVRRLGPLFETHGACRRRSSRSLLRPAPSFCSRVAVPSRTHARGIRRELARLAGFRSRCASKARCAAVRKAHRGLIVGQPNHC